MSCGDTPSVIVSLIAGGVAGVTVDTTLFPLDTLKTRLQSSQGFWKAGGFRRLYNGLGPVLLGSAPTAALFFCSYNTVKEYFLITTDDAYQPVVHIVAASVAEVVSCLVKVPTEILKQRQQVGIYSSNILGACHRIYSENGVRGFYHGLSSTILREIPFSIIQFPVWEFFMTKVEQWKKSELTPLDKALCGAVAGGIAASLTTPVDVIKTRIMLSEKSSFQCKREQRMLTVLHKIYVNEGIPGLSSPREMAGKLRIILHEEQKPSSYSCRYIRGELGEGEVRS